VQGVILSYTKMGTFGFCSNVSVVESGVARQLRFRKPGNTPMQVRDIHIAGGEYTLEKLWVPGSTIVFDRYTLPAEKLKRSTHPEDVMVRPRDIQTISLNRLRYDAFLDEISPYIYGELTDLFPDADCQWNGRPYVPANTRCLRSVGYIRPVSIKVYNEDGRWRVSFPSSFPSCNAVLKDEQFIQKLGDFPDVVEKTIALPIIRLALAEAFQPNEETSSRCYVMVTHIIDTLAQVY